MKRRPAEPAFALVRGCLRDSQMAGLSKDFLTKSFRLNYSREYYRICAALYLPVGDDIL